MQGSIRALEIHNGIVKYGKMGTTTKYGLPTVRVLVGTRDLS